MGAYSRGGGLFEGGGLLTICSSRVGLFEGEAFSRGGGGQFKDLRYYRLECAWSFY